MDDNDPFGSYGLCSLELHHKPLFDAFFRQCIPQLSDYTFANTWIWRDAVRLRWRQLHDCLCLFANGEGGLSLLCPPLGEGDFARVLAESMAICQGYNDEVGVTLPPLVEYINSDLLAKIPSDYQVSSMSGDYVYATRKMIDLAGPDLAGKRKGVNRFLRRYESRCEELTAEQVPACLELLGLWQVQAQSSPSSTLSAVNTKRAKEIAATINALLNTEALDLSGMTLYAADKLIGFTLGETLADGQTCSIIIEKTDRNYQGAANYIFSEFCRRYFAHTSWCNAGDDWDIPTLAWTKQSYAPVFRVEKYYATPPMPVQISVPPMPGNTGSAETSVDPYVIEQATPAHLNQLLQLEDRCFTGRESFNRRQLRDLLQNPRATVYAIRRDEWMVGAAVLTRRRCRNQVTGRLYSLAIAPEAQRQGLGRRLVQHCLETLAAEGVTSVVLEVAEENGPALNLYERSGFTRRRRMTDYYGAGRNAWKMAARLPARKDHIAVNIE